MLKNRHIILVGVWILAVGLGLHTLMIYKGKAGIPGQPPLSWPRNGLVSLPPAKPLLIMFAHPRCPCTKASLGELEQLVAGAQNQFEAAVLFYEPKGSLETWSSTPLIRDARAIPGVHVMFDEDGGLAKRFHVAISGHTLVYSPAGNLLFTGGITSSRGHLGDNAGFAAILKIVSSNSVQLNRTATPVFGCELYDQCARNQIAGRK